MGDRAGPELPPVGWQWRIERSGLGQLFDVLQERGYRLVGPTVRDGGDRPG